MMTRSRRTLLLVSLCGYALALVAFRGCYAPVSLSYLADAGPAMRVFEEAGSVDETEYEPRASGLLVGPLTADGTVGADALWADESRDDVFRRRMSNTTKEETILRSITLSSNDRVDIELKVDGEGDDDETVARNELVMEADGDITMLENEGGGMESTFDPPVLLLPPILGAGEEITRTFEIDSKGLPVVSGKGTGTAVLRGVGRQPLRTPAGDFNAFVLESLWDFTVGAAKIEFSARSWIDTRDDGAGLIAEEQREVVKVFGLKVHDVTRVSVIEDVDADTP